MARIARGVLALLLVVGALPLMAGTAAAGPAEDEGAFVALLNDLRALRGAPALTVDVRLTDVARAWSGRMAGAGAISHNPSLAAQAPAGWQRLGENVGVGGSVLGLHNAFVASPGHLANMVDGRFNAVGVGVVVTGTTIWVTVVFMQAPASSIVTPVAPYTGNEWYRMAGAGGELYNFGATAGLPGVAPSAPVVAVAATPSGGGSWLAAANGAVYAVGDAGFYGSVEGLALNQPIVGMAATPSGRGYLLVARDGGVFSFGDAAFHGSTGDIRLNQPIVGMTATPSGRGYWFVAADGGVFSFGDAAFHGSTGDIRLNQPIVGMASSPRKAGYWLVARDGGIFSFGGVGFHGSTGDIRLNQPIVGMAPTPSGNGYRFVAADGGVFSFGDGAFLGSLGGRALGSPVVAMVAGG